MVISEKEIELERLKTTVMSLNGKCSVVDDHVDDVNNTRAKFDQSEQTRGTLQVHIVQTAQKVEQDNTAHTEYQEELVAEINNLK